MAAYQNSFQNGRPDNEPRAVVGCRSIVGRRINRGLRAMKSATQRGGTHVVPKTYVVPENENEAAKAFSCVLIPFSRGELARAGKRGKDAAKRWKDGEVLPSTWTMLNMAQEIPAVRNWMLGMLGLTEPGDAVPPDAANALLGGLQFVAQIPGPDGEQARAMLAQMDRGA